MKKNIMLVIITAIICIAGTSYAAYKLKASEVSFDKSHTGLNGDNIQTAIDEITTDILSYGNAEPNDILKDKTALVNGRKITGTMPNNGIQSTWNPSTSTSKTYNAGYYPSSWTVSTSNAYNSGIDEGSSNATVVKSFIYGSDTNIAASFNSGNQVFGKGKFIICISHGRISSISININNCSKKEQLRYGGSDYNGGQRIYFVESNDDTAYISISGSVIRGKDSSGTQYPAHAGFTVIKIGD